MDNDKIPSDYEILTRVANTLANMMRTLEAEGESLPNGVNETIAVAVLLILAVRDKQEICDCPKCRAKEASLN